MSLSILFGIIGLIATVAFGIWGIVVIRRSKYPGKITFISEQCISLFHDIARNMPDLSILHKNHPVKETLVFLKGYFLNSGTKDITESMSNEDLSIDLPKDFKWVEAKVVDASKKVQAKSNIDNDNRLSFKLGLFRCNEFIKFEALAEVPINEGELSPGKRLLEEIQLTHRIADTKSVERIDLPSKEEDIKPITSLVMLPVALIGIPIIITYLLLAGFPVKTHFLFPNSEGQQIEVKAREDLFGKITVSQVNGDFKKEYSRDFFFSKLPLKAKVTTSQFEKYLSIIGLFAVFLIFGFMMYLLSKYYIIHHLKMKRYIKLLKR